MEEETIVLIALIMYITAYFGLMVYKWFLNWELQMKRLKEITQEHNSIKDIYLRLCDSPKDDPTINEMLNFIYKKQYNNITT